MEAVHLHSLHFWVLQERNFGIGEGKTTGNSLQDTKTGDEAMPHQHAFAIGADGIHGLVQYRTG